MHSLAAAAAYRKKEENAEDGKLQTPKTDDTLKKEKKRPPNLRSLKTTHHLKHEVKCLETS